MLYVLLDIFSRYVVGWLVAYQELATLAERLIAETATKQGIAAGQLTLHADRGSSMTSKPVASPLKSLAVPWTGSARPSRLHAAITARGSRTFVWIVTVCDIGSSSEQVFTS